MFVMLASACATGDAAGVRTAVRDSAGVQIVENWGTNDQLPVWRLADTPHVSIGVVEGEPAYQLDGVAGARLLDDEIVVLNSGSGELRFFDLEGHHVRSVGRRGSGPGEMEWALWLGPHFGDSLAVFDIRLNRLSIFDARGNFGRVAPANFRTGSIAGRLDDGTFILRMAIQIGSPDTVRLGLKMDSIWIFRGTVDSERLDTVAMIPNGEFYREIEASESGQRRVRLQSRPFGGGTSVSAGGSWVYVGTNEDWSIDVLDRSGALRRSIRRTIDPEPLTQEIVDRWRSERLAQARTNDERRTRARIYAAIPLPEHLPHYGFFEVDDEGNLWVGDHWDYIQVEDAPASWTVFDSTGRMIARITTPPDLRILQIGRDFVLGRELDGLDVQHVVLYRLEREPVESSRDDDPS